MMGKERQPTAQTVCTAVDASRCKQTYLFIPPAEENKSKGDGSQEAGNIFAVWLK